MKTEKISVNLSPTELGQIDLLVDRGLVDSRSDFMRSAARKSLESYANDFQQFLEPDYLKNEEDSSIVWAIGISGLTKSDMTRLLAKSKKIHIRVIGLYTIAKNITPQEIQQSVLSCKIYGKLIASDEIKHVLDEIENEHT